MSKRGENIHKRKDGRWEGRYKNGTNENGTARYSSVYAHTYSEVKIKLNKARSGISEPPTDRYKDFLLKEVTVFWLASNRIRFKGATENKYTYMLETHILPELGDKRVSSLTSTVVNTFLNEKLNHGRLDGCGGLSASYVRTLSIIISSVLKYASNEGMCPSLKTPIYKPKISKSNMQILAPQAQKQFEELIVSNLDLTKFGTYISLQTGLRIGEICALAWNDIDFTTNIIHVRHTVSRIRNGSSSPDKTTLIIDRPKTDASVRDIPISSVLLPVLKGMQQKAVSVYVVSDNENFVSTRTFDYRYRRMLKSLGIIPINFHALRHTFATRCVDAGVDIKSLSEILGHSSVAITLDTYVHPSMEDKRIQIEKLYLNTEALSGRNNGH